MGGFLGFGLGLFFGLFKRRLVFGFVIDAHEFDLFTHLGHQFFDGFVQRFATQILMTNHAVFIDQVGRGPSSDSPLFRNRTLGSFFSIPKALPGDAFLGRG